MKRTTKKQMLEDALRIQSLLARGRRPTDIQAEMNLTRDSYYRRYALLIDMAKHDFNFDRTWAAFIRYRSRLEGVAVDAQKIVEALLPGVGVTTEMQQPEGEKKKKAIKAKRPIDIVAALKLIVECEDKIIGRAMDLGIVNRAAQKSEITMNATVGVYDEMSDDELIEQARAGLAVLERNGCAAATGRN